MDSRFKVTTLSATAKPQTLSYLAMHSDYSESPEVLTSMSESRCGEIVVDKCLKYGHWGVVEHPSLSVMVEGYPHFVMAQTTRHRLFSFDVQSMRYTGSRMTDTSLDIEDLFYFPPVGRYSTRDGSYTIEEEDRTNYFKVCRQSVDAYKTLVDRGVPGETARNVLSSGYRQHFVMTGNLRSWLHFLSVRGTSDVQLETRFMAGQVVEIVKEWCPEIGQWFIDKQFGKNKLAP